MEQVDLKLHMENLIDQESSATWKPFPEQYVNTRIMHEINIPQISAEKKPIHVHCKITDDFATMQQYSFDEDSLPPKVLCWNDLSALDIKMATKTVKAGIEREYKYVCDDLTISFQSVSVGNRDKLPIPEDKGDRQLIYHVLDPTLTQNSRITPVPIQPPRMKLSKSLSQLKGYNDGQAPISVQTVQQPPIQEDHESLRLLCEQIPDNTIFILDCSFADDALKTIVDKTKNVIVFAATQESLLYNPQLPCDLFTSCLLTPAKVALLWQSQSYSDIHSGLLSEIDIQNLIDMLNDSSVASEILDMLEKALEAYVDQMAFEVLQGDHQLFYKVFRRDALTSRLFSNFIFAVRMMKTVSTLPSSYPELPDLSNHDLWDSFYLQVDRALYSIKESMLPTPKNVFSYNELLEEQMNCLESWLWFPKKGRPPPNELPFVMLLLRSPKFFKRAIYFCSRFLEISPETTVSFLNTRSFPFLPELLKNPERLNQCEPDTIAHFSFAIVNCVLLSPQLAAFFEDHVSFWLDQTESDNENLLAASLSCLLLFSSSPGKIEMYKERLLNELLLKYVDHNSRRIRTLSHLILSKMGIGLDHPLLKLQDEPSPLCRAAILSRITTTMDSPECSEKLRAELFYDLMLLVNDPYPLVREEALVALSHSILKESNEFFEVFKNYIIDWRDDKANNPIVTLLGHEIEILMFEPSKRVNERLSDFLKFFAERFEGKAGKILNSNLATGCLSKISHPSSTNINSLTFSANAMVVKDYTLSGKPSMSPCGLLSCGDTIGQMHCQTTAFGQTSKQIFNYFKLGLTPSQIPLPFKTLAENRSKMGQTVEYQTFIDDSRLLAISSRSQVAIINYNEPEDAECAFWMSPPDASTNVVVDYNHRTFQILHSTGSSLAHIYDIESQKKLEDIRLPRQQTRAMQWLKPYSSLFYVAQDNFLLFDNRVKGSIACIENGGIDFLSANCSCAMPLYLVTSTKGGVVQMYDTRMMKSVANRNLGAPLKQFDIHKQLPFAVGLTTEVISFSFENGTLTPEEQDIGLGIDAFALHQNESSCAVRFGNTVKCCVIDY